MSENQQPTGDPVHTSGGAYIAESVHTGGGDFVGRDQRVYGDKVRGDKIIYGFEAEDVERLIDKVLAFLQAGASFSPIPGHSGPGQALQAELEGERLTFQPGAIQRLASRRDERSYLLALSVHRDYQVWATRFIPLAAQMDVRRAIEGLELPVTFSEFRPPPPGAGPTAQAATIPLEDITEALERHTAFIILGEPGSGKTTTLQKIAFETARSALAGQAGRLPLLVRLSQQGDRDPFEFLGSEWERRTGSVFADALAAGRLLALVDGINEMPRDGRDERLKAWRHFSDDYAGGNQIVFTSREKDYDRQLDLPRVRVEPLDDARIADYLQRNGAAGLGELLDDPRNNLRQMARNPFNLCLLTYAYKCDQGAMANRGALLAWFADELFRREEKLAHAGWLARQAQVQALAQLAYAMQQQGESTTFPYQAASQALPAVVVLKGEQVAISPESLFRLGREATLLDPAVEPDVRFYHHLLQEYFAALELLRRFEAGENLGALWTTPRLVKEMPPAEAGEWDPLPEPPGSGWEVTTILACGLASCPEKLVEAVRPCNPALAGRCLDEAGILPPEAATRSVCADLLADLYNPAVHLRARLQAGFVLGRIGDPRFELQTINGVKVILPEMVDVPAGTYSIGSQDNDPQAFDDEKPQHRVELPAFAIARWPLTNAEFACFIAAGGYQDERCWEGDLAKRWLRGEEVAGGPLSAWMEMWQYMRNNSNWKEELQGTGLYSPDQLKTLEYAASLDQNGLQSWLSRSYSGKSRKEPHFWRDSQYDNPSQPVVGVTWFEARAYCAWLSALSGRTYRLPSEAEWEAAARGAEGRCYPWGQEWDAGRANTLEGRVLKPSPVGAYAAAGGRGPFGAEDQSGNAWEWTASLYGHYPSQREDDPGAEGERVLRGGGW
ncbi:MAG: SUMF1/EgtB/PvdO family nonheme iron enzyme, partial [Anaerolineales bacterium]|nr:SUMF1/EgtB/PvdO family nonheme iron enzyme [Anaerolineales bacterium]